MRPRDEILLDEGLRGGRSRAEEGPRDPRGIVATSGSCRGQVVTGVGSTSPVMRTAPNVDPSRRILSDGSVPNTWPYPPTDPQKPSLEVITPPRTNSLTVRNGSLRSG